MFKHITKVPRFIITFISIMSANTSLPDLHAFTINLILKVQCMPSYKVASLGLLL